MGLYVVGQSVSNVLLVIPAAVITVLLPRMAARSTKEIVASTGRAVRVIAALMSAASLTLILIGPTVLHFAYGARFDGAAPILRLLLLESVLDGVTGTLGQAFLASDSPGTMAMLQGCGLLTAVPMLMLLVPRWGIMGAAVAFTISTLARFLFVYFSFQRRLGVKPPALILRLEDIRALRASHAHANAPETASTL
jgi:O-antigen/teichoic acid export membrane protein